jgi:hypothetical protein
MPSVRIVSSRLTIQIRKYSPPVARNSKCKFRRAAGAAAVVELVSMHPP